MRHLILSILVFLLCQNIVLAQNNPEAYGFHSSELINLVELASSREISVHSLHVSRFESVFIELYVAPFNDEMLHDVASVTKSIISILTWKAVTDSILTGIDIPAIELLPAKYSQNESSALQQITVRNLLDMRSGWECGLAGDEAELSAMRRSEEWIQQVLSMPFQSKPGTEFSYCSPNYHVLATILQYQTGDLLDYARQRLFEPLGIIDFEWQRDPLGVPHGWGDLAIKPADMIKIGQLLENEGIWNQQILLPSDFFAELSQNIGAQEYRLGFWFSESEYEANGRGGQRITIIPSLNIVIVMTGGGFEPSILGEVLGKSFSGQDKITPDLTGFQQLLNQINDLKKIPSQQTVLDSFVLFNGSKYSFDENDLSIEALKLTQNNSNLGLQIWLSDGRIIEHPLRKDGDWSVKTINNMGQAGKIIESSHKNVVIEFNTLSLINRYTLALSIEDNNAFLEVTDLTNQRVYRLTQK
jgi:CubicO group peptidase (beta-lactamase class C family)